MAGRNINVRGQEVLYLSHKFKPMTGINHTKA
jgi:hypothetical protein